MTIGIFSLRKPESSVDLPRFTAAAKALRLNIVFLHPSDICVRLVGNKVQIIDRDGSPIHIDGAVNWNPYSSHDEISYVLALSGIPFINSIEAVRNCRNKMLTSLLLNKAGILQPQTIYYPRMDKADTIHLGSWMPVVFKRKMGTHGIGASKLTSETQLNTLLSGKRKKDCLYFQKYVENFGYDYRVVVVGRRVIGALKKSYAKGEWRTHAAHGGQVEACDISPLLASICLRSAAVLDTHFAGIDVMPCQDGKYYVLEVNSVPGMSLFFKHTGINIAEEILKHLIGLVRHEY